MKTDETNPDHWFELAAGRLRSADRRFAADPRFDALSPAMERLTDQFWAQHYPGGDVSSVGSDFRDLRKAVGSLLDVFESVLGRRIARP